MKKSLKKFILPAALLIIILISTSGYFVFLNKSKQEIISPLANKSASKISPTKIPSPTATPSATISPTSSLSAQAAPLSGFCERIPVLLYHHIQPYDAAKQKGQTSLTVDNGFFDQQMAYLSSSGYNTLSADQLVNSLISHQQLQGKDVVVTLDDGYQDIFTYAYPIAQKYHIILNLMIPTGLVGGNPDYLTWGELKEMVGSGLVFAYDHTWSHASLGNAPLDKIKYEILTAKTQLEQNLGRPVTIFTYPYGSENSKVISILKENGFTGAFSTIPGFYQCDSFIMSLHRNRIGNSSLAYYGL